MNRCLAPLISSPQAVDIGQKGPGPNSKYQSDHEGGEVSVTDNPAKRAFAVQTVIAYDKPRCMEGIRPSHALPYVS